MINNQSNTIKNPAINGKWLYYTFIAGANKILENQNEINKVNIFPVPDADTGTNLASTIRSVMEQIKPNKSYKITANSIAEAALIGARGNSGIIFAQFLYGLSEETVDKPNVSIQEFAESIKRAVKYVYDAVANPIEGTMLTVIRDWADFIYKNQAKFDNINTLLHESFNTAQKSLQETKERIVNYAKINIVDAGALGFVSFIEGIINFVNSSDIRSVMSTQEVIEDIAHEEEITEEMLHNRFCTEAIIKKASINKDFLQKILTGFGDSVVIAGSEKFFRIHVHTNRPDLLFYELKNYGTITYQKAEDMVKQFEAAHKKKWNIAIVTDSTCDLPDEIMENYQVYSLPLTINFGDNQYLDKITMKPQQFYEMMEQSPIYPTSAQVNEKSFTNLFAHLASHYDNIIVLPIASALSGTYNSARKASETINKEFGNKVVVLDSKHISGTLGLVVLRTAQAIESGMTFEELTKTLNSWIDNVKIYVSVKKLKYIVKSGRVSPLKGLIAKLLNIIPIISMDNEGKSVLWGKNFSQKGTMKHIIKHLKNEQKTKTIKSYIVMHTQNPSAAEWYVEKMQALTGKAPEAIVPISPVVGVNTGIGTAAVAVMYE